MLHPQIQAVESDVIHGRGLIALAPINEGEIVSRLGDAYTTYLLSDVLAMPAAEQQELLKIAYQNSETTMVAEDGPERFMNHSCDPNTWWLDDDTMIARRDIAAGEEVTYDYATSEITVPDAMTCRCGSALCRGVVTHLDYLDPAWQARYGIHLPSHTLRAIERANERRVAQASD